MRNEHKWEWYFNSEPARVRPIVAEILGHLDKAVPHKTNEERGDLRLIFSELLYNAVLHGNASDKNKMVHIRLTVTGRVVRARITDEGSGHNYIKTLSDLERENDVFREKGRGLQLVKALADNISFERGGRCVSFEKNLGRDNE